VSLTRPVALAGGVLLLAVWVVLAFVLAIPAGWVHLALALGVSLLASAIILTEPASVSNSSRLDSTVK
jgi:hypothetical protein